MLFSRALRGCLVKSQIGLRLCDVFSHQFISRVSIRGLVDVLLLRRANNGSLRFRDLPVLFLYQGIARVVLESQLGSFNLPIQ